VKQEKRKIITDLWVVVQVTLYLSFCTYRVLASSLVGSFLLIVGGEEWERRRKDRDLEGEVNW